MIIENLVKLQDIDTQLTDIEELLGDLPTKVEDLNNQEKGLVDIVTENKSRVKEIDLSCAKNEGKLQDIKEKIEKYKEQLFAVTNNKQYDAMMNEMDFLKQDRDKIETEELNWLEEKETLETETKEKEDSLEALTLDLRSRRETLKIAILNSAEEKKVLEEQRSEATKDLSPEIMALYKKVLNARNGYAVVELVNNACGGCGAVVPPQTASEIRNNLAVHNCGSCGRFIYGKKKEQD
ncbi:MAG: hypothetical protein HN657_03810 [Candidatus Marinimicrobia bacterium]|jgi:hypothetical protein|nr:hypothetical protein [Candidatus Neomarinimicrobiota bacterium]MBT3496047.1 hypothetical protein [Candidatus Neomarinimicrobiota bacterium]MBT3692826.1 hypothetical protein [Candidatus Neomarinimicrobiota bacterium]MBT3732176.1 hypothetical protein [Candidatus Neomarinimicrobiota bacterium]MBT4144841.1 hypothetical protein [Candidatus Neomarinimicrobiota bacterium]